ncbi:hypothetical protein CPB86DRAFT_788659 [Serendipita vermifera]|nr:hypothetical protein CPB86DRAFT_788659 [Serendipita vermifera]
MAALPFPHPRQIPTEAEVRLARSILEELEQSITSIESNIQELQAQLLSLRQQRANYVSYISPFRRIPPEILAEIALICFHSGESLTKLTQINSTFRDAVTGTGSIWRRICLTRDGSVRPFRYHILVSHPNDMRILLFL